MRLASSGTKTAGDLTEIPQQTPDPITRPEGNRNLEGGRMTRGMRTQTPHKTLSAQAGLIITGLLVVLMAPTAVVDSPVDAARGTSTPAPALSTPSAESRPPMRSHVPSPAELERAVTRAAQQHRLHPALLLAVMKAESSFNPIVVSKAGAVGLMQLVPETAMRHGVRHLYDTDENVAGGARHLRYLLDRFHGNTRLALAAYNAGERKVDRYKRIPPYKETQHYVQKVLSYYRDYRKDARLLSLGERYQEGYTVRKL
jgi:soluble lytic murein transglycosylase-like protein